MVFAGEVTQVDVPGVEGDFGVLAGHAPLVATLKPGVLTVSGDGGPRRYVVLGVEGFYNGTFARGGYTSLGGLGLGLSYY